MRFVFVSYIYTSEYKRPEDWLRRVKFYGGILESLALNHTVISIEQINYEGEYQHNGVQYYFKRISNLGRHLPFKIHRFIKSLEPDVVFVHGLHFPFQVLQLRGCLGNKVKMMVQHHAERPSSGIKKALQHLADRYIDAYLFASRDLGLNWIERGNLSSSKKIHEVMEVSSTFYPIPKPKALHETGAYGAPVYFWVGRLDQNKDPLMVVKAFLQFASINTSARLYMIFHTDELLKDVIALLDGKANANNSVTLIGEVEHEQLLYWYNSADFLISGSHYEAAGTAVCEALSCGIFPVLTNIPSFRMMTGNGTFGLLYEAGNEQALLNCLWKTISIEPEKVREPILDHYNTTLSFAAIAGKISEIASSL